MQVCALCRWCLNKQKKTLPLESMRSQVQFSSVRVYTVNEALRSVARHSAGRKTTENQAICKETVGYRVSWYRDAMSMPRECTEVFKIRNIVQRMSVCMRACMRLCVCPSVREHICGTTTNRRQCLCTLSSGRLCRRRLHRVLRRMRLSRNKRTFCTCPWRRMNSKTNVIGCLQGELQTIIGSLLFHGYRSCNCWHNTPASLVPATGADCYANP